MSGSLWFSLYTHKEYVSKEAPFVNISSIAGVQDLERNYQIVLNELEEYLKQNQLKTHFNTVMVEKSATWKVQGLRVWGLNNYKKQKHFKKTMALLNAIPNVTLISFNLLEPQSNIKPHFGDTNAIIRCHLGLKIPAAAPTCALKVKEEVRGWQEGKVLGFIDAYTHEAWNHTDEIRIILLFDILKPEFVKQKSKICATIRASLFLQSLGNIFPKLYTVNRNIYRVVMYPHIIFLRLKLPVRNLIRYLWHK
jgi:aspartyl/asparaginyl beta-hydroxylase (cupin superfamily)